MLGKLEKVDSVVHVIWHDTETTVSNREPRIKAVG